MKKVCQTDRRCWFAVRLEHVQKSDYQGKKKAMWWFRVLNGTIFGPF